MNSCVPVEIRELSENLRPTTWLHNVNDFPVPVFTLQVTFPPRGLTPWCWSHILVLESRNLPTRLSYSQSKRTTVQI